MRSTAAVLYDTVDDLAELDSSGGMNLESISVTEPTGEEVLVDIEAASLCYTDVSAVLGEKPEPYPIVLGHEGAGIVRETGDDVEGVEPGDHVVLGRIACGACDSCRAGHSNLCSTRRTRQTAGTLRTGAKRFSNDETELHHFHGVSSFTEHTIVTEEVAIPITDEVPLDQATLLGCGVFTGIGSVMNTADIEPGSSVAVFGAGGVGLSALQGADMRSASEMIVVDPIPEKLSLAAELGATHTVNPTEVDPVERIQEITDGGADYAIEAVGNAAVFEQTVNALGRRGTAVLVGTAPSGDHDLAMDLRSLATKEKTILGSFNGSYNLSLAIPQLAEFVADGRLALDPMITNTRPLDELGDAMVDLKNGDEIRQVIVP